MLAAGEVGIFAQTPPDLPTRKIVVLDPVINLSFGDFTVASGSNGTLTVSTDGSRSYTGGVFPLNLGAPVHVGVFEFKLCPGRTVRISYPTDAKLYRKSGGGGDIDITGLTFAISGGTIDEKGTGYIKFTSNRGCNEIHRILVGGVISPGTTTANYPGEYYTDLSLTLEQW